jgi:NADH-quinone oxidoreductase subunit H
MGDYINNFNLLYTLIKIVIFVAAILGAFAYLTLLERWIAAWVQDRKGPNRVGPFGLLQPIADGGKFFLKEEVVPGRVDRLFYLLGPTLAMMTALLAFAVVPFGSTTVPPPELRAWPQTVEEEQTLEAGLKAEGKPPVAELKKEYDQTFQYVIAPGLDIGIVFIFAIGSLNVYSVILGGWASNNKYSFLGGLRASAQVISYEIPLGMSIIGVALLTGSLNLERIINYQIEHGWLIFYQPLACLLFVAAVFAECSRLPFDLTEAEQELVAGYHTEYSGMKFAMYMIGEYTHMVTTCFLVMVLFFGGWQILPFVGDVGGTSLGGVILKLIVLIGKMSLFIVFYMMIRWTLPRFRFDQLMGLAWKVLIPLTLVNLVAVMVVKQLMAIWPEAAGWLPWTLLPVSLLILVGGAYCALLMPKPPPGPSRYVKARLGTPEPVVR